MIKGYKAFKKGMKCKGMQFAENTTFEMAGKPVICEKGFHFCENPLDTLNYYDLCDSEFAEVVAEGEIAKNDDKDSKIATNKIHIGAKLDLKGFVQASVDFLWEKCKREQNASGYCSRLAASGDGSKLAASGNGSQLAASGDYGQLAASGDYGQLAASGDDSQLAASGNGSKLAASGYGSQLAASGNGSQLAASGNHSKLAASGNGSKLAASGDYGQLAASGNHSKLAASGDYGQLSMEGNNSVGANIGINGRIKGNLGCWITLAEYDQDRVIKCVKSAKIDGETIKADTWYRLVDGEFVSEE